MRGNEEDSTGVAGAAIAVENPLDSEVWAPVRRDLRRRDAGALRMMLGRELDHVDGPGGRPVDVDGLLRFWARFSQAVYDEDADGLCEDLGLPLTPPGAAIDWNAVVAGTFGWMLAQFPPADTDVGARCRATFAVFVYAETIVFWEYAVVQAEVTAMRRALTDLAGPEGFPGSSPADVRCGDVVRLCVDLMGCLEREQLVEAAMSACAVEAVRETAATATARLAGVGRRSAAMRRRIAADRHAGALDAELAVHLDAMIALAVDDLDGTVPYFALLGEAIAPACSAFLDNLRDRAADASVAGLLRAAAQRCRDFEHGAAGVRSVFGTEVRAHRIPIEAAAAALEAGTETLELAAANVTYLYPFGLPVAATGIDVLPELMSALKQAGEGAASPVKALAGARVVIDDTPHSDGWLASTSVQERDYRAFRAVFPDHELALTSADGVTYTGLDLDVRLSGMGNHYVRVRMGTDTLVVASRPGSAPLAWSPHELEQAIRRGGQFAGAERVWLRARTPGCVDGAEFTSLLALAGRIVADLARAAHEHERSPAAELARDLDVAEGFLARYCQVLVTVSRAAAVSPGGVRRDLVDEADLEGVLGVQTALTAQRSLAQSVLEWVVYPRADAVLRHRRTLGGRIQREVVWCAGDLTALFVPSAPHWRTLETQAHAEYAASLIGVYWRRQQWLRQVVDEVGAELDKGESDLVRLEARAARLSDAIRHVQLLVDRANEHTLSKDQQGREVLQHLMGLNGVADLRRSLDATVDASQSTQRILTERIMHARAGAEEENQHRRQRPLEILLAVLAVVGIIDVFVWVNEGWGLTGDRTWWIAETTVVAAVAVLLFWLGRRAWQLHRRAD